ncbi:hypothetical protein [Aquimarina sp. RZ0]|uniref:hypothetical protein n=1 Tax=Aquimarina sp. RZ0 TaxID=2607730 RepID=UPI0011F0DB83|nr:hypothetical protein [Aquimarina sp. RZ0]KAA1243961.1 hypothetical protein F0000_18590 [Aquimarina sp. RZ0]
MKEEFLGEMSQRIDKELIKILNVEKKKYKLAAIKANEFEVKKRNIDTSTFIEITKKVTAEREKLEKVETLLW